MASSRPDWRELRGRLGPLIGVVTFSIPGLALPVVPTIATLPLSAAGMLWRLFQRRI